VLSCVSVDTLMIHESHTESSIKFEYSSMRTCQVVLLLVQCRTAQSHPSLNRTTIHDGLNTPPAQVIRQLQGSPIRLLKLFLSLAKNCSET
jgi:hypothetical protein